jgi:hypothetical protein
MAFRKLVVIPLFWGPKWSPKRTVFRSLTPDVNAVNMISGMWTVMRSWYMEGLLYYGIEPGFVHPGTKLQDAPPPLFKDDDCWNRIDQAIGDEQVPQPDDFGPEFWAHYAIFPQPVSKLVSNPDGIFGRNKGYHEGSEAWSTANSDLAGGIEYFAHEMVEGVSPNDRDIVDECYPKGKVVINGLTLQKYAIWEFRDDPGPWLPALHRVCWPDDEAVAAHRGFTSVARARMIR